MAAGSAGTGSDFSVGVFDWLDPGDTDDLRELYERRIELAQLAEESGFHAYHLAEHHGTPLSLAPSASVFLAALAQRTSTIRLCPLVYLLPMHDPLRLVEEICMLDHLSDGRFEVGVGRGASPYELAIFGVSAEDSRAVFEEALEVVVQGLRDGRVDFQGKYFTYDDVLVSIRPRQQPYPPLWYPTISPGSVPWLAEEGFHTVYGFGFLSPSNDETREQFDVYRRIQDEKRGETGRINGHVQDQKYGLMRHIYVAESDEVAVREARSAFEHFYESFDYLWALHNNNRFPRKPDFDGYLEKDLILVGSPDTVRDSLVGMAQHTGANYFAGAFAFGDMPHERILNSVRLFTQEIKPALEELDV